MKRIYESIMGKPYEVEHVIHDVSKYERLLHMTPKKNINSIRKEGLVVGKPQYKSLIETKMIHLSYPVDGNTTDVFRFHEESHAIVVLDAKALAKDGYEFYDDYWTRLDQSSKRNHVCTEQNIPPSYIVKIITFDDEGQKDV